MKKNQKPHRQLLNPNPVIPPLPETGNFNKVALPEIKQASPALVLKDLVSFQPMTVSKSYYTDFVSKWTIKP